MKFKLLITGIIIIAVFIIGILFFIQDNDPTEDIYTKCCEQCVYGSQHDPSGYDIGIESCYKYEDWNRFDEDGMAIEEKILTSDCAEYFQDNNVSIAQCYGAGWGQPEVCNSFAGKLYGGEEINEDLGYEMVSSATRFLEDRVGKDFFDEHYYYACENLTSDFKYPEVVKVLFEVRVLNKELNISTNNSISVGVNKDNLNVSWWDVLLTKESLEGDEWFLEDDVMSIIMSQVDEEVEQKMKSSPDEILVEARFANYGQTEEPRLEPYWLITIGEWHSDFCQFFVVSMKSGEIINEQNCASLD